MSRDTPHIWDTDWLILRRIRSKILDIRDEIPSGATLLDLGCGDSPYRNIIQSWGIKYLAADLGDQAEIKIIPGKRVEAPDKTADAIISIQVLEHVRDIDNYLSEAYRLLQKSGKLFLSTHGSWLYHPHPEDHRRWTKEGLINELETRNFHVEKIIGLVGPLATTSMIRLTGYGYVLNKIPLIGHLLTYLLALVMNIRAYCEDLITPTEMVDNNACVYWVIASPLK